MLLRCRIAQNDRPAWKTRVHTPRHDDDGNERLRPVYLVYRCGDDEDLAVEKKECGQEKHVADFSLGK